MYNRYIPQPDGSYRKNQLQEQAPQRHPSASVPQKPKQEPQKSPQQQASPHQESQPELIPPCKQAKSADSFLRQLLPKNMDTGDLLVILLLLLMAGDGAQDNNIALLTLALYLML